MALGQGLRDSIDEDIVIEKSVDLPECGIPELVGVGQEHFHEAALPVRSPHHGASGEAARPQGVHRVSCAAARRVRSRCSLTITHRVSHRQRITVHSDRISERQPAQTRAALGPIRTGKYLVDDLVRLATVRAPALPAQPIDILVDERKSFN